MVLERLITRIILWFYQLGWQIGIILRDRSGAGRIPDDLIEEIARCLLPDIVAYCESDEGKAEFAKWKAAQDTKKKEQSEVT